MELTQTDQLKLEKLQLERYREIFGPLLTDCALIIFANTSTLAIATPEPQLPEAIAEQLPELRVQAWFVLGLEALTVYCSSKLVVSASTTLHNYPGLDSCDYDYSIVEWQEKPMLTATPVQTTNNNGTQSAPAITVQGIPELRSLSALAQASGQPPQAIAEQILILRTGLADEALFNCLIGHDPGTGEYKASDAAIALWVDSRISQEIEQLVAERREVLMRSVAGNGETTPTPAPSERPTATRTARKPAATKAAAKAKAPAKATRTAKTK